MRKAVIHELTQLAATDERVVLLTGDLGFMVIEEFADTHPGRFVNVGVAEANMMGLAAGLALRGMRPYCYSIATFASLRGYEQLRNGAHLHDLQVRVIGVGGGFGYGHAGITHHALEDVAVMRALPRMRVIAPADDREAGDAVRRLHTAEGPTYFRLSKDNRVLSDLPGVYDPDRPAVVGRGDVTILALGTIADEALRARSLLADQGVEVRVAVASTVAPLNEDAIAEIASSSRLLVTLEDHVAAGGFGGLVAETLADCGVATRMIRLAVRSIGGAELGGEHYLRQRAGIDAESVMRRVLQALAAPVGAG